MLSEADKKRPDPFDPRIGTGRENKPDHADEYISDEDAGLDADDEEIGDGKELGG